MGSPCVHGWTVFPDFQTDYYIPFGQKMTYRYQRGISASDPTYCSIVNHSVDFDQGGVAQLELVSGNDAEIDLTIGTSLLAFYPEYTFYVYTIVGAIPSHT